MRANAEVLLTFNTRDFPEPALKPYDVIVIHLDEFLLDQLDLYPGVTVEVLRQQAAASTEHRAGHPRSARTRRRTAVRS